MTEGIKQIIIRPLNLPWIIMAVGFALLCIPLYIKLRGKSREYRRKSLLVLSGINLALFVMYLLWFQRMPGLSFLRWDMLPIDLCNLLTIFFVIAFAVDNQRLYSFCYFVGITAGIAAILSPEGGLRAMELFSPLMIGFYFVHCMLYLLGISIASLKLYKPTVKDALLNVVYLEGLTLVIYFVNLLLRNTVYPEANFFFLFDAGESAYLEALHAIVPISPFTMMVSVIPVAVLSFIFLALAYKLLVRSGRWIEKQKNKP